MRPKVDHRETGTPTRPKPTPLSPLFTGQRDLRGRRERRRTCGGNDRAGAHPAGVFDLRRNSSTKGRTPPTPTARIAEKRPPIATDHAPDCDVPARPAEVFALRAVYTTKGRTPPGGTPSRPEFTPFVAAVHAATKTSVAGTSAKRTADGPRRRRGERRANGGGMAARQVAARGPQN